MKMKELQDKTEVELHTLLADARENVRVLRFGIAAKQVRNVREMRENRKVIARILTLMSSRKS